MSEPQFRNFDAETEGVSTNGNGGHTFQLAGREFHTKPKIPAGVLKRAAAQQGIGRLIDFVEGCLVKDDIDTWRHLVDPDNHDVLIDEGDVAKVTNWLLEVLSKRPTPAPGP